MESEAINHYQKIIYQKLLIHSKCMQISNCKRLMLKILNCIDDDDDKFIAMILFSDITNGNIFKVINEYQELYRLGFGQKNFIDEATKYGIVFIDSELMHVLSLIYMQTKYH